MSGLTGLNRRHFLASAGVAAAAAAVAPGVYAAGSDTIRVGMIGCGGQGTRDMISCVRSAPGVEIVALGDLFQDRLNESLATLRKEVEAHLKVTPETCFVGFDACDKVLACDIDMVLLTAPPNFRPPHLKAAIAAGKHVFMEKPAGVDPVGIRSVIETAEVAREKGLSIVAGTQRRHSKRYRETLRRIHDGAIGDILSAQAYWVGGDMLGYWKYWEQGDMSDIEWQMRSWPWFVWTSGDHIVEQHVHNLDVINWAMGAHPVQCIGMGGRAVRDLGNIYDNFSVEYEYPNGARVLGMCRQINGCANRVSEFLIGTKGMSNANGWIGGENAFNYEGDDPDHYVQEMAHLIHAIRTNEPINEAKAIAESTMTAIMGRISAYTGLALKWDWVMNASKLDLQPAEYSFDQPFPMRPLAVPGKTQIV